MKVPECAPVDGEMLYGVKAIATFLGIRERQALHLVETSRIPFFRTGKIICARPQKLRAWLDEQEAMTASAGDPATAPQPASVAP